MFPQNWRVPMGAPAIFEKQIEIKLLHPASTEGVTDSGLSQVNITQIRTTVQCFSYVPRR
ncbi:MAG: hypothetical protein P8X74_06600 [Reinekea sp.]